MPDSEKSLASKLVNKYILTLIVNEGIRLKLKFWGVRGSINSPLSPKKYREKIEKVLALCHGKDLSSDGARSAFIDSLPADLRTTFGGNTSCVTVSDGENLLIFDAGTGIRELGSELLSGLFFKTEIKEYNIFFSHLHLDHINGLPFFDPVHFPQVTINFYSHHKDFERMLNLQQDFNYFPVSLESRPCVKNFRLLNEGDSISIGSMTVSSKMLNHPNGSYAYSVISGARKIVYATDGEYTAGAVLDSFLPFYKGADALIFDTQYDFNELAGRYSFGHSTAEIGVDAAVNAEVKRLYLFHHNHESDDEKICKMYQSAVKYLAEKYPDRSLDIIIANEGMETEI